MLVTRINMLIRSNFYHKLSSILTTKVGWVDGYHGLNNVNSIKDLFNKIKLRRQILDGEIVTPALEGFFNHNLSIDDIMSIKDSVQRLKMNGIPHNHRAMRLPNNYSCTTDRSTGRILVYIFNKNTDILVKVKINTTAKKFMQFNMKLNGIVYDVSEINEFLPLRYYLEEKFMNKVNYLPR